MQSREIHDWEIGKEQEVSSGYYATLLEERNGWRLWNFETRAGVRLVAGKGCENTRPLIPLGVAESLWGVAPFLTIHFQNPMLYRFHGSEPYNRTEYRAAGERYPTVAEIRKNIVHLDGKLIEISVISRPSEDSFTGMVEDRGIIDLTGIADIVASGRLRANLGL